MKLAALLFPDVEKTPEDYEAMYPERGLAEGARVTRFAPSPTGFLHIGGLFAAYVAKLTANTTGGVFFLDRGFIIHDVHENFKGFCESFTP